ncbi:hypothetical protein BD324DRAFT_441385 [Kockovaella imperatae]|uniref:Enoyl reductase (ER) domain-containing protein n=1 Tax=Kockovaella imperatae TaxID=4999 RepID=A0A1Y1UH69_9TREE|nr:hypothetical protein BD324DRAFT_441385 [Kockovaella imperatae]ORX37329.1 hypothetical protein BD324DRAFT_441385 [Kockovaella imperatae]
MVSSLAYVQQEQNGKPALVKKEVQLPEREPQEVLVKVSHVAQNPTDVQSLDLGAFGDGTVLGCDFVGAVEEFGRNATRLQKGDVIAGLIWGGEKKGLGGYGTHTYADESICFKVETSKVKPEEAATVPLACTTAWLAMLSKDCLAIPRDGSHPSILIWGGSSSVGQYAIQLASHLRFKVITTASSKNHELLKSLGADHVFDYKDESVVDKIREAASDLRYVFDTIGNETSSATASKAVRQEGGSLCTVRPGKGNTDNVERRVKVTDVLVWTVFLKDHAYKEFKYPASFEDRQLGIELFEHLPSWLATGRVKPNAVRLMDLDSIHDGFQLYRDGKISAEKVVYAV